MKLFLAPRSGVAFLVSVFALACGNSPEGSAWGPDADDDGWPSAFDCNDADPGVFPAADDVPGDGVDADCSGSDEETTGLGGAPACVGGGCGEGTGSGGGGGAATLDKDEDGFTPAAGDCDDGDPEIHPGAHDVPGDDLDQDCFGGDSKDGDGDGYEGGAAGDDCDDENPSVHPGRAEVVLDGIDQNCDGSDLPGYELVSYASELAKAAEAPALAAGKNEGDDVLLAVWADSRTAPRQDLFAQLVSADGAALGEEIPVDTSDNNAKYGVRVASKGDGFLVSWTTVNGVYVRRLNADGTPNGIILGYGSAGGVNPSPAFGGTNWVVAWVAPGDNKALIRAMTPEGVRGDIVDFVDAAVASVDLVGANGGLFGVWDSATFVETESGIFGRNVDNLGVVTGETKTLVEGAAQGPRLAVTTNGYGLTYRVPGSLGFIALTFLDEEGDRLTAEEPFQLSLQSVQQTSLVTTATASGVFSAWADYRHSGGIQPAEAIYGNEWLGTKTRWSGGLGLVAAESVGVGGVVFVDAKLWVSVRVGETFGLVRQ